MLQWDLFTLCHQEKSAMKTHDQIIQDIHQKIEKKYHNQQKIARLQSFASYYYATASIEELQTKTTKELFAILVAHWQLINKRKPKESLVNIFNTEPHQGIWQRKRTLIQVSHDNMPFLVDSLRMAINRLGYLIRFMIHTGGLDVTRDAKNEVVSFKTAAYSTITENTEAPIHIEIDLIEDPKALKELDRTIEHVLNDVTIMVEDWPFMLEQMKKTLHALENTPPPLAQENIQETCDFLRWLLSEKFVFFGCRDYRYFKQGDKNYIKTKSRSGFGVLRHKTDKKSAKSLSELPKSLQKLMRSEQILIFAKTNTLSTIHREAYTDFISIKQFDKKGTPIGERRFVGVYTAEVYQTNPEYIPVIRQKVAHVIRESHLAPKGYGGKTLKNILNNLPRDDLFQASANELLTMSVGILHLQESQKIRLFLRKDHFGRYYSSLLFIPRDRFTTKLRWKLQNILVTQLKGRSLSFTTTFPNSALARLHFIIRIDADSQQQTVDVKKLESLLREAAKTWEDNFKEKLIGAYGETDGAYFWKEYGKAFPIGYRDSLPPTIALHDIEHIEVLSDTTPLSVSFFKSDDGKKIHLKLFRADRNTLLSDVLPMLENMGVRVVDEAQYKLSLPNSRYIWINDFEMEHELINEIDIDSLRSDFRLAFEAMWMGFNENDGFNRLVLRAGLSWRQIAILRAYAKYFQQIGLNFSQRYIEETLYENARCTRYLVDLFYTRFDPKAKHTKKLATRLQSDIHQLLDKVDSLDQDRILRQYLATILATRRTNFFQKDQNGEKKLTIAFKIYSKEVPNLPLPHPLFEIFVYSPWFEGIHLRGAKVARGGLRWSDRREDFRTEILGLMKAQQVKNAVIVPLGAKGGFVVKHLPKSASRDEIQKQGIRCYQDFIRSLLDITDNLEQNTIIPPLDVVRHDEDDPYLVVAADKGTATFSDIANQISKEYQFWLGDAFASGGSAGYDHKKMGITAKGAWESVKRHFREMGINTQKESFTVVGIGDMSGDVFGNGMLLSKKIRLVAAFNHQHIFLDPNPDEAASYKERRRLFRLPRSSWSTYDKTKISKGGGIYSRKAKFINLSDEIKKSLQINKDRLEPNELIRAILKAPVDLLWNGGIGTYVKASTETDLNVGDRSNDALRINASALRCKVIGEGGNLGLTQLARIEYALQSGKIYTDAIDNSAGVDCSDHEVNIKIVLNQLMREKKLTLKKRNDLLVSMTDDVASLVLKDNYRQTQAISLASLHAPNHVDLYARIIGDWEEKDWIDREIEFLPDDKALLQRKANNQGLTPPELSVLFAYSKIMFKKELLESELLDDDYLLPFLWKEFPAYLQQHYAEAISSHQLKREIIATQLTNSLINQMGITMLSRLKEETSASTDQIVRAFLIARHLFNKADLWHSIEALDYKVTTQTQLEMMKQINQLLQHSTRWLLQNYADHLDLQLLSERFDQPIKLLVEHLNQLMTPYMREKKIEQIKELRAKKVPQSSAEKITQCQLLVPMLDLVEAHLHSGHDLELITKTYHTITITLNLDWFREQISILPSENKWDALAKITLGDDFETQQRILILAILDHLKKEDLTLEHWLEKESAFLSHWETLINHFCANNTITTTMLTVALKTLTDYIKKIRCK